MHAQVKHLERLLRLLGIEIHNDQQYFVDPATGRTVIGDFDGTSFDPDGDHEWNSLALILSRDQPYSNDLMDFLGIKTD